MIVYLTAADGQWRWSPPGRLRVDVPDDSVNDAALLWVLVRTANWHTPADSVGWKVSLDG